MLKPLSTVKRIDWKGERYPVYHADTIFKDDNSHPRCPFCERVGLFEVVVRFLQYGLWRDVEVACCICKSCGLNVGVREYYDFKQMFDEPSYDVITPIEPEFLERDGWIFDGGPDAEK